MMNNDAVVSIESSQGGGMVAGTPPGGVSAHVMEGSSRFARPEPESTLFESGADIKALAQLHHRLEFFPTPPWSVRAMLEIMDQIGVIWAGNSVLEPAAGRGHIVEPMRQAGFEVMASDIHDHGKGYAVADFLHGDHRPCFDAVVTNPPFKQAEAFVNRGLWLARHVIVLCRLSFLNSAARHDLHFANPAGNLRTFMPCIERVPMVLGRYDPKASTATEFAWFHYERGYRGRPDIRPIPPGSRAKHQRPEDVRI